MGHDLQEIYIPFTCADLKGVSPAVLIRQKNLATIKLPNLGLGNGSLIKKQRSGVHTFQAFVRIYILGLQRREERLGC